VNVSLVASGTLTASGAGSFCQGRVGADGGILESLNVGTFAQGNVDLGRITANALGASARGYCGGGYIEASGQGATASGSIAKNATLSFMLSNGLGTTVMGACQSSGHMQAFGEGSAVIGSCKSSGTLNAGGNGSFAGGSCQGGSILSTTGGGFAWGVTFFTSIQAGNGGFAQGNAGQGNILATGNGAFAQGTCAGGNAITASGSGSFAQGWSSGGPITAGPAASTVQFGVGVNNEALSLKIGATGAGIHIKGGAGAFAGPANGQIYVGGVGNVFTTIHSNGKAVQLNCGNATGYTLGTFTPDFAMSNTAGITATEVGDILATLITDLRAANIIN
jgi:hypothetical protein